MRAKIQKISEPTKYSPHKNQSKMHYYCRRDIFYGLFERHLWVVWLIPFGGKVTFGQGEDNVLTGSKDYLKLFVAAAEIILSSRYEYQ